MRWVRTDWVSAVWLGLKGGCHHEFTVWAPREQWTGPGKQWWRVCTKCKVGEVRHSETEPTN